MASEKMDNGVSSIAGMRLSIDLMLSFSRTRRARTSRLLGPPPTPLSMALSFSLNDVLRLEAFPASSLWVDSDWMFGDNGGDNGILEGMMLTKDCVGVAES